MHAGGQESDVEIRVATLLSHKLHLPSWVAQTATPPPSGGSGSGVRVPIGTRQSHYSQNSSWKSWKPIKTRACTLVSGSCCPWTQVKGQSRSHSGWGYRAQVLWGSRREGVKRLCLPRPGDPGTHTLLTDKARGLQCAGKPMSFSAAQAAHGFCAGTGAEQAISEA